MRIIAIASYKKGVRCVAFSTLNLQNFAVDLSLSFFIVSASMVGPSDSEIENSYSDESEFKENESEILLGLSNGGVRCHGRGEGTFVCPFCHSKKVPSWSLHELLQHANGKSRRGDGISGLEHSALAKYILSNDAETCDRELGGVGDCGGNEAVKARRDQRHVANKADKEACNKKVLKK